jgi:hypothetical protein
MNTKNENPHVDDMTLGVFLEIGLAPEDEALLKAHLRACAECFLRMATLQKAIHERASLRFEPTPVGLIEKAKQLLPTPEAFVAEAKQLPAPQPAGIRQSVTNALGKLKDWLIEFPDRVFAGLRDWLEAHLVLGHRIPIAMLPAGALAVVVLLVLLWPKAAVENFALDSQLIISAPGPLGFVSESEVVKYKGMSVGLSEDGAHLIFKWPAVPNASFYEITLITNGEKRKITPLGGVSATNYALPKQEAKVKVEYVWELSGKLQDERGFVARAGFVCRK